MISHYVKPAVKVLEQGRKGNWTLTLSGEPLISHKGLGASDQYLEQSPSSEGEGVGEAQPCFYHITWFEEYLVSQVRCTTKQKGCNVSTTGLCYNLVATNWRHPSLWARMVWQANSTAGLGYWHGWGQEPGLSWNSMAVSSLVMAFLEKAWAHLPLQVQVQMPKSCSDTSVLVAT